MKNKRLKNIKNTFIKNLTTTINRPISVLNNKKQRILLAKTKFLAQYLELNGMITSEKRKNIINRCNNCIEEYINIDEQVFNRLLEVYKKFSTAMNKALSLVNTGVTIQNAVKYDYLTVNKGRDHKMYVWFLDESNNIAVEIDTLRVVDDGVELKELFL